jgi:FkbM family methyltransferase
MRNSRKSIELSIRKLLSQRDVMWIDYGWMNLPFRGDGDRQELYYHLEGARWWKSEKERLSPFIKSGDIVFDVGANLGFFTALFSKLVGNTGVVHSFEPSPRIFKKLQEVIEANHLANVVAHNIGCGDVETVQPLYTPASSGNSSFNPPEQFGLKTRATSDVRVIPLDAFLASKINKLSFLKIDTEGFEDKVLRGAARLIDQFRPVIYIELTSEYFAVSRQALAYLKEHGYHFPNEPVLDQCHNGATFLALPR